MTFRHIILTRFNLQYEIDSTTHIQPTWLQKRFNLFETYCLPSVEQQTCQNFTWILLSSDQTPEPYRKRLLSYCTRLPQIKVVFCSFCNDYNVMYKQIGKEYAQGYSHLLSTRLDNDDMLERHFIETVQKYIETHSPHNCVLSFPFGVQWFVQENIAFPIRWQIGHFHTFFEETKDVRTSLGMDHRFVPKNQLILLPEKDAWCEIVHYGNICNDYTTTLHYYLRDPNGKFPIPLPTSTALQRVIFLWRKHVSLRLSQIKRVLKRL